jgi:hypothetical protein
VGLHQIKSLIWQILEGAPSSNDVDAPFEKIYLASIKTKNYLLIYLIEKFKKPYLSLDVNKNKSPKYVTKYFPKLLWSNFYYAKCPGSPELRIKWNFINPVLVRFDKKKWPVERRMCLNTQSVYVMSAQWGEENFNVYKSLLKKEIKYYVHASMIENFTYSNKDIECQMVLPPTLSFRTLRYSQGYIKFGLPIHYGGVIRNLSKKEVLHSLFISNCLQQFKKNKLIGFLVEDYALVPKNRLLGDYCVSVRGAGRYDIDGYIPFAVWLSRQLETPFLMLKLASSLKDKENVYYSLENKIWMVVEKIYELIGYLSKNGTCLELHGQNLLVDEFLLCEDALSRKVTVQKPLFLYRDYGNCLFQKSKAKGLFDITEYSALSYRYKISYVLSCEKYYDNVIKKFVFGNLLYSLDEFSSRAKLQINPYFRYESRFIKIINHKNIFRPEIY